MIDRSRSHTVFAAVVTLSAALAFGANARAPVEAWPLKPFPRATASPSPTAKPTPAPIAAAVAPAHATPSPVPTVPDLYVRGSVLAVSQGYLFFTAGNAVRLAPSVVPPQGPVLGRAVRVTLDQATRMAKLVELSPRGGTADEIDASQLPSQYAALVPGAAATSSGAGTGPKLGSGPVTVTFNVFVPGNTPPNDDIFIATDRSNFSPSEIRMQRSDPQHWTASLTVPSGTEVHYEYTRGTYATVERDRFGGIIVPRGLPRSDGTINDSVARWADLN